MLFVVAWSAVRDRELIKWYLGFSFFFLFFYYYYLCINEMDGLLLFVMALCDYVVVSVVIRNSGAGWVHIGSLWHRNGDDQHGHTASVYSGFFFLVCF